ncbi:uncharacterized protein CTRU02_200610 [Colletotrichum truncatum]|uniref:Uncharacterized protein n=1 Tax=Colletotrichum truncatum TaxID=5467 RepID=A0ACC3ZF60_COLTU|nr:uncharacterized protein CTRU02_00371 [Colletotrichum truncatum]KAF6801622.1 hypothetical protein CTRU02_00371 [Colletotrichum truncatum]
MLKLPGTSIVLFYLVPQNEPENPGKDSADVSALQNREKILA